MNSLQQTAFLKALHTLKALNCKFAVITEDGQKHGELEVTKAVSRSKKYSRLEIAMYIRPFIENMQSGQTCEIPSNGYPLKDIQPRVCDWFAKKRGPASVITRQDKIKDVLEVLCIN